MLAPSILGTVVRASSLVAARTAPARDSPPGPPPGSNAQAAGKLRHTAGQACGPQPAKRIARDQNPRPAPCPVCRAANDDAQQRAPALLETLTGPRPGAPAANTPDPSGCRTPPGACGGRGQRRLVAACAAAHLELRAPLGDLGYLPPQRGTLPRLAQASGAEDPDAGEHLRGRPHVLFSLELLSVPPCALHELIFDARGSAMAFRRSSN